MCTRSPLPLSLTVARPDAPGLVAAKRGEGLNLADFGAAMYGPAFTVETGMKNPMADRVALQKLTVQTAVDVFERRHA